MPTLREVLAVPLPLEQYGHAFDDLFHTHIQRRRFREYLAGLLLPRERNKTLTALVGAEPITQAQTAPVQQLQFFLSESEWDAEALTTRRIAGLQADLFTRPHAEGVLVIDETGDRKDGTHTAHVGYQYLGSIGKLGNGIVAVTSLWADERMYYPLHVRPYTPAARLAGGKQHPTFRTKPQLALELVEAARAAGIPFRAVVADSLYGEHPEFTLAQEEIPFVLAVKPAQIVWTPAPEPHSPLEAAHRLRWRARQDARHPGAWTAVTRRFHDGHEETWWAVDLQLGGSYGPERSYRLVVATSDPRTLPQASTWYLITTLPLPGTARAAEYPNLPAADLTEVVRLYGLRQWIEQGYKQVKQELGWADFQVRSDRAIRRHWALVCCAFAFCWWAESRQRQRAPGGAPRERSAPPPATTSLPLAQESGAGGKGGPLAPDALTKRAHKLLTAAVSSPIPSPVLAPRAAAGAELA
jgi:DDE superfamily endonuclease